MREAVGIARSEDKAPSKLKRIPPRFVLAMAGCPRPCSRCGVVAAKQMQQVRGFQFCGSISQPLLVDQQRKRDPGFLPEKPPVLAVPPSHGSPPRPPFPECPPVLPHLPAPFTPSN